MDLVTEISQAGSAWFQAGLPLFVPSFLRIWIGTASFDVEPFRECWRQGERRCPGANDQAPWMGSCVSRKGSTSKDAPGTVGMPPHAERDWPLSRAFLRGSVGGRSRRRARRDALAGVSREGKPAKAVPPSTQNRSQSKGAISRATMLTILMSGLMAGPAVSL